MDREDVSSYVLELEASDGGIPPYFSSITINITITDTNDNQPIFLKNTYEVDVVENSRQGDVIIRVEAEDRDEGVNGEVEYSWVLQDNMDTKFSINKLTGESTGLN